MTSGSDSPESPVERPVLRVVRGNPTDEELAALVAVVSAVTGPPAAPPARSRSEWAAPRRAHRRPPPVGATGWRSSSLPS